MLLLQVTIMIGTHNNNGIFYWSIATEHILQRPREGIYNQNTTNFRREQEQQQNTLTTPTLASNSSHIHDNGNNQ